MNFYKVCELKVHPANQVRRPCNAKFHFAKFNHCKIPTLQICHSNVRIPFLLKKIIIKNKKSKFFFFYSINPNFLFHFSSIFCALLQNFYMTVKNLSHFLIFQWERPEGPTLHLRRAASPGRESPLLKPSPLLHLRLRNAPRFHLLRVEYPLVLPLQLLYTFKYISLRRYHFLPLFLIAIETLRTMFILVGEES